MYTLTKCKPKQQAKASIKGAKKFVCLFVPPFRMVHPGTPLSSGVTLQEVQFQDKIIDHKQYYNEKCRHYIIIVGTAPTAATKLHTVASSA